MSKEAIFWTTPTQSTENPDHNVMVTGRKDVNKFRENPRFKFRVEVTWTYNGDNSGMPSEEDSMIMEQVTDALNTIFKKDPVAVMTGIYTGDGKRDWIFYTLSLHIFQRKFNEALAELPPLPLEFYAEEDPEWNEYQNMCELTEIPDEE